MSHRSSPRPSSMGRRPIVTTEEQDVHTGWRRVMCTFKRAGQSAKAKRRSRRRERAAAKRELRQLVDQECCHPDFHELGVHAPDYTTEELLG